MANGVFPGGAGQYAAGLVRARVERVVDFAKQIEVRQQRQVIERAILDSSAVGKLCHLELGAERVRRLLTLSDARLYI